MRKHRLGRALIAVAALSIVTTPLAVALEQAGYARIPTSAIDGVKGNQGIRTDPVTVNFVGFVHPTQVDTGAAGGDFVAIGTANGAGAPGDPGQPSCANDYDPKWTIYADGATGGLYWCADYTQDAYTTGANPTFQIYYDFCSPSGPVRWVLSFGGVQRRCVNQGTTSGDSAIVMLETTGASTTDRNIDVKYTNLKVNLTGSATWVNFDANFSVGGPAPNYSIQIVNGTAVNAYLAPLE